MVDFMLAQKVLQRFTSLFKSRQIMDFDVRRQGILRRAHRPDVDMVDIFDILHLKHFLFKMMQIDSMRDAVKRKNEALLEKRP